MKGRRNMHPDFEMQFPTNNDTTMTTTTTTTPRRRKRKREFAPHPDASLTFEDMMSEDESPSKKKKIDEEFRSSINNLRRDVNDRPTEIPMYHTISEGDGMWVCTVEVPG